MVNLYVGITDYDWFRFLPDKLPSPATRRTFPVQTPCTSKLHCWWRGLRASRHPSDLAVLGSFRRKQRGTVILAADVAGYSRLMGADEEGVALTHHAAG
jgi:hypothetical protein